MNYLAVLDIGTRNVRLSYYDRRPAHVPTLDAVPALVGVNTEGKPVWGKAAEKLQLDSPERVISLMECLRWPSEELLLGGRFVAVETLIDHFLQRLRQQAEEISGLSLAYALLGVPQYLKESQLRRLRRCCLRSGGLEGLRLVTSNVLAAFHYACTVGLSGERKVLFCDLGAGGCDFTLASLEDGVVEILSATHSPAFSGERLTWALAERAVEDYEFRTGERFPDDRRSRQQLLQSTEHAKRALAQLESVQVILPGAAARYGEITRTDLFELLRRSQRSLSAAVRQTLEEAVVTMEQVDRVLLSGELTRILGIEDKLGRILGKRPLVLGNASGAAADGGAVLAGSIYLTGCKAPLLLNATHRAYSILDETGGKVLEIRKYTIFPTLAAAEAPSDGHYTLVAGEVDNPRDAERLETLTAGKNATLKLQIDAGGQPHFTAEMK